MTTLILLLLGLGSMLVISGIEDQPLTQTISEVWAGDIHIGNPPGASPPPYTTHGTGPFLQTVVGRTAQGSAAGPAQQDAYRQAVVRAYLQARK